LDNVDGLGSFLEIEVPVGKGEAEALVRLEALMRALGYRWADCIRASYAELITNENGSGEA
jgi:adenylate cyclase class IV